MPCGRCCANPAPEHPRDFVDLIETDPARRVKLEISHERLAKLHPADIADIVEDLAPDEREAVFKTLDEEVAAGALEEVDPEVQKAIVESLSSERAAGIVEEMDRTRPPTCSPIFPEERTSEILLEMQPQERKEMVELLEFKENTAAGRMNTEYLAVNVGLGPRRCGGPAALRRRSGDGKHDLPGGFRALWPGRCRWLSWCWPLRKLPCWL